MYKLQQVDIRSYKNLASERLCNYIYLVEMYIVFFILNASKHSAWKLEDLFKYIVPLS